MKIKYAVAALLIVFLSAKFPVHAQAPTATLVGRVVDQLHAVVAGVSVQVRNKGTNNIRTASTNSQGEYTVSALEPGEYDVLITAENFKEVHEPALLLEAGQTARLDAKLIVGSTHEEVNVTAEVGVLNSETSDKGDVVSATEISETPLNGRDFNDLVFNIAGVAPSEEGSKGSAFVANGARSDATSVIVDGINNTNPRDATAEATPPLDALQEFKVQTSNFSAEYGRMAGPVINLVIKKGSNQLKGSVFEFVRNDLFDARNHFDTPGTRSELRRNQFGATVGGPVFIPHFYNGHNKTFFMVSWESYRDVDASNELSTVPTPLERSGDFSQSYNPNTGATLTVGQLKDPLGHSDCVTKAPNGDSNYIPVVSVSGYRCRDQVASSLMNFYPQPTAYLTGQLNNANNYIYNARNYDKWDDYLGKIDQQIGAHDEASFKAQRKERTQLDPFSGSTLGIFGSVTGSSQSILSVTETHIFSPTLINEFRTGLTRNVNLEVALDSGTNWANLLGIAGTTPSGVAAQFPNFKVTSYATIGDSTSAPIVYTTNNFDTNDAVTMNKGKHTIKMGGDLLKVQYFQPTNSEFSGALGFNGKSSGNGFADFMRGNVTSVTLRTGTVVNHLLDASYSTFVQDDFKAFPSLTLNLGLRYEFQALPREQDGQFSNFIPALNMTLVASNKTLSSAAWKAAQAQDNELGLASDYKYPQTLIFPNHLRFAPRVGFAWRPFNDNRTTVRGGYGIFYTGSRMSAIRTDLSGQFPFSTKLNYEVKNGMTIGTAFTANPNPSVSGLTSANGYDPHAPSAYLQSWNLTMERELPKGFALELAYTGSKGTHLGRKYDINQLIRVAPTSTTPATSYRLYSYYNTIDFYSFGAYSSYNAATVTLRKRYEHGLMLRMNYTYGKSLDTASGLNYAGKGGYSGAQNSQDPNAEYGRSDSDRRHVLNGNWVYQLPFRRNIIVRGWGLAGSIQAETGTPLTPQYTVPNADSGQATRPDRICSGELPKSQRTQYNWFNTACFVQVPDTAYRFGTSRRNILTGPNRIVLATSLSRNFQVKEYGKLQFRWEVFDATNHTNFNTPIDTLDTSDSNTIKSSQDPRVMQLGAKFLF